MNRVGKQFAVCVLTAAVTFTGAGIEAMAGSSVTSVLPSAGIGYELATDQVEVSNLQEDEQSNSSADSASSSTGSSSSSSSGSSTTSTKEATNTTPLSSRVDEEVLSDIEEATGATTTTNEEETFSNLVIAQVNDYVNVRSGPSENDEIVGKLYNNSVGTYLGEENGWYQIKSGSVTGYVKAEYCVTGQAAVELAPKVGKRIATVTTTTLKVRKEASTESEVLGLVPIDDELVVLEELDGWVKVEIEEGEGYVSMDYVRLSTEFVQAESKAEEEARLAKEQAAKEAARAAASSNTSKSSSS